MDCVSACKISIPAYSPSPGPLQEAEALQAALAIVRIPVSFAHGLITHVLQERLSAEVSLFPPESMKEGRMPSASDPFFTSASRTRRKKRKTCNIDKASSSISPGSPQPKALSGGGRSSPPPPADDSFDVCRPCPNCIQDTDFLSTSSRVIRRPVPATRGKANHQQPPSFHAFTPFHPSTALRLPLEVMGVQKGLKTPSPSTLPHIRLILPG